jgi:hypothetical protein
MIVPPLPNPDKGFHALWPGMDPDSYFVFQNVVNDDQPVGAWSCSVWYGPNDIQYTFLLPQNTKLRADRII